LPPDDDDAIPDAAIDAAPALDPTDDGTDPAPDGTGTLGSDVLLTLPDVETFGIETSGAPPVGINGRFGSNGIELYFEISQLTRLIAP
jgi:hypothetical protein